MVIDIIICIALTAFGTLIGMDKVHDIRDYIGPALILGACAYALWLGFNLFALIIGAVFLIKVLIR
ncbi:MAG: hypothetical protein P8P30_00290 [Rickettsiales bacterium]|nr:hypothetical protein [Rickettsiales bacterium]